MIFLKNCLKLRFKVFNGLVIDIKLDFFFFKLLWGYRNEGMFIKILRYYLREFRFGI